MTHVILGHCCKDASCVRVCPQNCIHPAPGEPGFDTAETLHIDPRTCIDCTACVEACPASAIKSESRLTPVELPFARRNREYFAQTTVAAGPVTRPAHFEQSLSTPPTGLRVAVVGSGPAALYTVRELLRRSGSIRVTVFEQHEEIGGLLRRGVSLDHPEIRDMLRLFDVPFEDDRVDIVRNTEIGVDISVEQLRATHDAVVLACGASQPRHIGAPAAGRPGGVHQALDILVAANLGGPGTAPFTPAGPRAIVVGAGNVALDVVRLIAKQRHRRPAAERVRELTVLSRSGPDRASFTPSAFYELLHLDRVDTVVDTSGATPDAAGGGDLVRELAALPTVDTTARDRGRVDDSRLRVVLSFGRNVTGIDAVPGGTAETLVVSTESGHRFTADSVVCAAGFITKNIEGIPVGGNGIVANLRGRVVSPDTGLPLERLYVVGWAKRGASGGVGDNRTCAAETIAALTADLMGGHTIPALVS